MSLFEMTETTRTRVSIAGMLRSRIAIETRIQSVDFIILAVSCAGMRAHV